MKGRRSGIVSFRAISVMLVRLVKRSLDNFDAFSILTTFFHTLSLDVQIEEEKRKAY